MSDASQEVPEPPDETICQDCGEKLSPEEIDAGRDLCFECYLLHN
jgi:hypothetical protein